jgi:hypothetical protein
MLRGSLSIKKACWRPYIVICLSSKWGVHSILFAHQSLIVVLQYSPETKFFAYLPICLNFRYRIQSLPQHLHPGIMRLTEEGEREGEEGSLSSMTSSSSTQQGLQEEEEEGEAEDAESTDKVRAIDGIFVGLKGAQS